MTTTLEPTVERWLKPGRNRAAIAVAVVLGAATLLPPAASPAAAAPAAAAPATATPATERTDQFILPAPTGPHPVGWHELHLIDHDRPDPWVPSGPRELMISVWYPAAVARGPRVPYASAEESQLLLEAHGVTDVPGDALTRVRSHARAGAPPLRTHRRLPLVVLSPGLVHPSFMLTALAEDLASRGYVVAGVDHTYEAAAVTFPDGRVVECRCDQSWNGKAVTASRAEDVSFVLDRLLGHRRFGQLINPHRIAAVGHSMGGAAAPVTMLSDRRVDAGINMDGSVRAPIDRDLNRPFLILGTEVHGTPGQLSDWEQTWSHLTGWRRWLHVPEMSHLSPCDAAVVGEWLGLAIQPLPGARAVEIIRTYVAAFADQHLRHRHQSLLDGPSPQFPEVQFVGPATG